MGVAICIFLPDWSDRRRKCNNLLFLSFDCIICDSIPSRAFFWLIVIELLLLLLLLPAIICWPQDVLLFAATWLGGAVGVTGGRDELACCCDCLLTLFVA